MSQQVQTDCWGKQMGDEGKEKWRLFSPLLGVYSTSETGLIYPLNINKQSNCHPKITLVSVGGLISGLKLSAGYTIPQARSEWSVFRHDHLRPLWVPQRIAAVFQVKRVAKKQNLYFNSWNSFLLSAGLKAQRAVHAFLCSLPLSCHF